MLQDLGYHLDPRALSATKIFAVVRVCVSGAGYVCLRCEMLSTVCLSGAKGFRSKQNPDLNFCKHKLALDLFIMPTVLALAMRGLRSRAKLT